MIIETGQLLYGNSLEGTPVPRGTTDLIDYSQNLNAPPADFSGYAWPPIGYPRSYNEHVIPAQVQFTNGNYTLCNTMNLCPASKDLHPIIYDSATYDSAGVLFLAAKRFPFQNLKLQVADAAELTVGSSVEAGATFKWNWLTTPKRPLRYLASEAHLP